MVLRKVKVTCRTLFELAELKKYKARRYRKKKAKKRYY